MMAKVRCLFTLTFETYRRHLLTMMRKDLVSVVMVTLWTNRHLPMAVTTLRKDCHSVVVVKILDRSSSSPDGGDDAAKRLSLCGTNGLEVTSLPKDNFAEFSSLSYTLTFRIKPLAWSSRFLHFLGRGENRGAKIIKIIISVPAFHLHRSSIIDEILMCVHPRQRK